MFPCRLVLAFLVWGSIGQKRWKRKLLAGTSLLQKIHFMVKNRPCEVKSCSEIPCILWNPKVRYCVHNSPPVASLRTCVILSWWGGISHMLNPKLGSCPVLLFSATFHICKLFPPSAMSLVHVQVEQACNCLKLCNAQKKSTAYLVVMLQQ
jgi:hypothetical protein